MDHPSSPAAPSFELGDIYYTLFRHKWKIIICSMVGLAAAFAVKKLQPPLYQSEAKLLIRFVITDAKPAGPPGRDDSTIKSIDQRGETIIRTELEILTSLDLAEVVVRNVGVARILGSKAANNIPAVAMLVQKNLLVEVPPNSSVLRIAFEHPDQAVAQEVLREIVASYLKRHSEIHRAVGQVGDSLAQETDQLRARLAQTDEELRRVTARAGIVSLEDFKKTSGAQIARLREQIGDLQADLAERTAVFEQMTKGPVAVDPAEKNMLPPPSQEQIDAYQKISIRLALLRQREQEALVQYTEDNPWVRSLRVRLAEAEQQKKALEAEHPSLAQLRPTATATAPGQPAGFDPVGEAARISALQARLKTLNGQLEAVRTEAAEVDKLEVTILELRRRKELDEVNYRFYAESLDQSRIKEALGPGRVSNITEIQTPTPGRRTWDKKLKLLGGLAVGGVGLGLAWAFAIEMFLDRTVRRPGDIERTLGLPLFLSIPKLRRSRIARRETPALPAPAAAAPLSAEGSPPPVSTQLAVRSDDHQLALDPYHQTLRDRLISYFDSINLRHKPKLVAVTGLGKDSGVTTTAAGLARSFSETGEGNVLLVDMTQGQGSAQHYHKGTTVGLDQLFDTRGSALVQDNLYVVGESSNSDQLAKGMPQRFNQLVPKLKTSGFDYIIFDMPPVSQISITPRLAGFMDMVLLVIESEKTDREIVQRATDLLAKSKTNVGVVMNKTKSYVPAKLHQDREFLLGT